MAKLYFKYGAMGSSKTANALITKFNYEERGMKVWLLKPATDDRDGQDIIKSRIGLACRCFVVTPDTDILAAYEKEAGYDATFDKDKNTIIAKKEGKMTIKIHYLPVSGTAVSADVELTFAYVAKQAEIKDMTWVVDGKKLTATSEIVGPSVDVIKANITAGIDTE